MRQDDDVPAPQVWQEPSHYYNNFLINKIVLITGKQTLADE